MESLKKQILIRAVIAAVLVGAVISAAVVPPLYQELKNQNIQALSHLLKTRELIARQSISQMEEVTRQITSRSMIRDRLVAYNRGEISLEALQNYTRPLLQDALDKSRDALGIRRLDIHQNTVVTVGETLPQSAFARNGELVLEGPFGPANQKTAVVTAPIHDRSGAVAGWDQVLFSLEPLKAVTDDYSELFHSGEAILAKAQEGRFLPHFELRNPQAPLSAPGVFSGQKTVIADGWVLSATPLNESDWWVVVRVPESELTALINHNVQPIVLAAVLLTLLAVPITIWLISPLLGRLAEEFKIRKEAEEALKELNSNLERAIEEEIARRRQHEHILVHQARLAQMGEMIGAIAHQWRQPLNALALAVQDLGDAKQFGELDDAYLADMTEKSMRLINQMSKTIDDFRGFFKSDRQKTPFDPARVIEESLALLHSQLERHGVTVAWDAPKEPLSYEGYPNEFKQVVLNLIANARDAVEERRASRPGECRITLSLRIHNDALQLQVADNGGGIPAEIADRIFDPYFTTKDEGKGVGLGLYMSKLIIEEHMGGRLHYENRDDGAAFWVTLPLSAQT